MVIRKSATPVGTRFMKILAPLLLGAGACGLVRADPWTDVNPGGIQMVADKPYQAFYGVGKLPRNPGTLQLTLHRGGPVSTVVLSVPESRKQVTLAFRPRPVGPRQGGGAPGEVADLWAKDPLVIHGIVFKQPVLSVMGKAGKVVLSDGPGPNGVVWWLPGTE